LLLCHPRAYGLIFWAMSAFAFYFVCVYGFASMHLLARPSPGRLLLAVLLAWACSFTLASGQVVWLTGAGYLGWQIFVLGERPLRDLGLWMLAAVLVLTLFHTGFSSPNTLSALLAFFLQTPIHQIGYFLAILGSAASFGSLPVALAQGVVIMTALAWLCWRDAISRQLGPLHFYLLFVLVGVFSLALGRAPYSNLDYALVPRYSFGSLNVLLCLLVLSLNRASALKVSAQLVLVSVALAFCIASYRMYIPLLDAHLEHRIKHYNKGRYWVIGYPHKKTAGIVKSAVERELYFPPVRPLAGPGSQGQ
jgi:hypothetical protein